MVDGETLELQWKNVQSRNKNNGVQRSKINKYSRGEVVVWAKLQMGYVQVQ